MTEHMPIFKHINEGAILIECSCGWAGGAHASRHTAKLAHGAHVDGETAATPEELLANWMWRLMAGMSITSQSQLLPVARRVLEWIDARDMS